LKLKILGIITYQINLFSSFCQFIRFFWIIRPNNKTYNKWRGRFIEGMVYNWMGR